MFENYTLQELFKIRDSIQLLRNLGLDPLRTVDENLQNEIQKRKPKDLSFERSEK